MKAQKFLPLGEQIHTMLTELTKCQSTFYRNVMSEERQQQSWALTRFIREAEKGMKEKEEKFFKSATTFDIPKDLYTSPSQDRFYYFPKDERDNYLPQHPCCGIFCLYQQIPLEGVNLESNKYMTKKDFFKAQ